MSQSRSLRKRKHSSSEQLPASKRSKPADESAEEEEDFDDQDDENDPEYKLSGSESEEDSAECWVGDNVVSRKMQIWLQELREACKAWDLKRIRKFIGIHGYNTSSSFGWQHERAQRVVTHLIVSHLAHHASSAADWAISIDIFTELWHEIVQATSCDAIKCNRPKPLQLAVRCLVLALWRASTAKRVSELGKEWSLTSSSSASDSKQQSTSISTRPVLNRNQLKQLLVAAGQSIPKATQQMTSSQQKAFQVLKHILMHNLAEAVSHETDTPAYSTPCHGLQPLRQLFQDMLNVPNNWDDFHRICCQSMFSTVCCSLAVEHKDSSFAILKSRSHSFGEFHKMLESALLCNHAGLTIQRFKSHLEEWLKCVNENCKGLIERHGQSAVYAHMAADHIFSSFQRHVHQPSNLYISAHDLAMRMATMLDRCGGSFLDTMSHLAAFRITHRTLAHQVCSRLEDHFNDCPEKQTLCKWLGWYCCSRDIWEAVLPELQAPDKMIWPELQLVGRRVWINDVLPWCRTTMMVEIESQMRDYTTGAWPRPLSSLVVDYCFPIECAKLVEVAREQSSVPMDDVSDE